MVRPAPAAAAGPGRRAATVAFDHVTKRYPGTDARNPGAVEEGPHRRGRLIQPGETLPDARPELEAVGLVLVVEPGGTETGDRAAVAGVVEGADRLRHETGVAECVGAHEQAQMDPLGGRRPRTEDGVALEDRLERVADDRVEVVPRP